MLWWLVGAAAVGGALALSRVAAQERGRRMASAELCKILLETIRADYSSPDIPASSFDYTWGSGYLHFLQVKQWPGADRNAVIALAERIQLRVDQLLPRHEELWRRGQWGRGEPKVLVLPLYD
jgi:hypothetical protein